MPCILCKVVLKNRKSYRNHVKNKHNKWLDVLFPKVDKKVQKMMKVAIQRAPSEDPSCPCSICGKIFKNKSEYLRSFGMWNQKSEKNYILTAILKFGFFKIGILKKFGF